MKNTIIFALIILSLTVILSSCKEDNPLPPENQPQVNLTLEDVSCTEAWIKLSTNNVSLPADVDLYLDSSLAETLSLANTDSLLYIDSLLPNQTYSFHTVIHTYNHTIKSDPLRVTTMDTTSHNFTWQSWTFGGQAGGCNLYDVAVINENDIWAVGRINIADTSQNGYTMYNAVHWDGSQWELKRLEYYGSCSAVRFPPLKAIWAFSDSNIVITNGGSIGWFNGNTVSLDCGVNPLLTGAINKIWGPSSNDLYVVGNSGSIVHKQNGHWSSEESGTDMALADMIGTSGNNIFICGADVNNVKGIILKKNNSGWETFVNSRILTSEELFNPDLFGSLPSIWLDEKSTLYAAGNLLYQYKFGKWDYVHSLPENYIGGDPGVYYRGFIADVKGVKSNDMWIAGDRNTLRHFNGVSWKQIGFPYSPDSDIVWYTVYPTENCVAVVGFKGNSAIVMLIKR
jgi:hypothetical protein